MSSCVAAIASGLLLAPANQPPTIAGELPLQTYFAAFDEVRFTITVTDPDGDPVDLRLASATPGVEFLPMVAASSPASREVRWRIQPSLLGRHEIRFEAFDAAHAGQRTLWRRSVQVGFNGPSQNFLGNPITLGSSTIVGDLDANGSWSVVVAAPEADVGAVQDAGAIYVWDVGDVQSGVLPGLRATLRRSNPLANDRLGSSLDKQPIHLHDVDGDGFDDVVGLGTTRDQYGTPHEGFIDVWLGGAALAGTPAPWVEFFVHGDSDDQFLGTSLGDSILFGDVTGDGAADLVVAAWRATVRGRLEAGRVYVYRGGPSAPSHPGPWAKLELASPRIDDRLGQGGYRTQGVQLGDVSGDGIVDVVVAAVGTDAGAVEDAGSISIWRGGPALQGTRIPDATLQLQNPAKGDRLTDSVHGLQLQDLSGDGVLDVFGATPGADVNGVGDTGAIAMWRGGPGLVGTPAPDALLTVPNAVGGEALSTNRGGFKLEDLTGDGWPDVVAIASMADAASQDSGAAFVWDGTALSGSPAPIATLAPSGTVHGQHFGSTYEELGFAIADVTGDGQRDLVVPSAYRFNHRLPYAGAIHVFAGGPSMQGTIPSARLIASDGHPDDQLGIQFVVADVTGDGIDDVVSGTAVADHVSGWEFSFHSRSETGAAYVWAGGSGLSGTVMETAELLNPRVRPRDGFGSPTIVADVTGDGVRDVIVGNNRVPGGDGLTGSAFVFAGGAGLTGRPAPTAWLHPPPPFLSESGLFFEANESRIADWNGDGILDVVAVSHSANVGGAIDAGAAFAWLGGPSLAGEIPPDAMLDAGVRANDYENLGNAQGLSEFFLSTPTSGERIFLAGTAFADARGVDQAGAIQTFQLRGAVLHGSELSVPSAKAGDQLGERRF